MRKITLIVLIATMFTGCGPSAAELALQAQAANKNGSAMPEQRFYQDNDFNPTYVKDMFFDGTHYRVFSNSSGAPFVVNVTLDSMIQLTHTKTE